MEIINWYGVAVMAVIMIPNIIFSLRHKESFKNKYSFKIIEPLEQIGRFGSFAFMVINIPVLCGGFWFKNALALYIAVNGALCLLYCISWVIFCNKRGFARAFLLSVLPSVIFVFSGVIMLNYPLILFSTLFAVCHIYISLKNVS